MMLSKEAFGVISIVLTAVAYFPYFRSLWSKQTKPHLFSWIIWALLGGINFFAQYTKGAGPGSWMLGFTTLLCAIIALVAAFRGEKNITHSDWIAFLGAILAIIVWYVTRNPLGAVIISCWIDLLACYPTLRKSYMKPWQEPVLSYGLQALRPIFSLGALESFSAVTLLPLLILIFSNGLLSGVLLWRRAVLRRGK